MDCNLCLSLHSWISIIILICCINTFVIHWPINRNTIPFRNWVTMQMISMHFVAAKAITLNWFCDRLSVSSGSFHPHKYPRCLLVFLGDIAMFVVLFPGLFGPLNNRFVSVHVCLLMEIICNLSTHTHLLYLQTDQTDQQTREEPFTRTVVVE